MLLPPLRAIDRRSPARPGRPVAARNASSKRVGSSTVASAKVPTPSSSRGSPWGGRYRVEDLEGRPTSTSAGVSLGCRSPIAPAALVRPRAPCTTASARTPAPGRGWCPRHEHRLTVTAGIDQHPVGPMGHGLALGSSVVPGRRRPWPSPPGGTATRSRRPMTDRSHPIRSATRAATAASVAAGSVPHAAVARAAAGPAPATTTWAAASADAVGAGAHHDACCRHRGRPPLSLAEDDPPRSAASHRTGRHHQASAQPVHGRHAAGSQAIATNRSTSWSPGWIPKARRAASHPAANRLVPSWTPNWRSAACSRAWCRNCSGPR